MIVALQEGLEPFRSALEEAGYRVLDLEETDISRVDVVVLTGLDDNMLGDQRTRTKAPVISAAGLSPQQLLQEIRHRPTH